MGGILVPRPDDLITGLPTDANGELHIETLWPAGFLPGFQLYFQYWIADLDTPEGLSASNGLELTTP